MKKLLLTIILAGLMTTPVLAVPSLGSWDEGTARSVHVLWTFDSGVGPRGSGGTFYDYTANPAEYTSEGNPGGGTATAFVKAGTYEDGRFIDQTRIDVMLEISNFPGGASKTIWVDFDGIGSLTAMSAQGKVAGGTSYGTLLQPPEGSKADFGFCIVPNPDKEDIWFSIIAPTGARVELNGLHVDTICQVPAPGAMLLGSIGISFVGWLRTRRQF